MSTRIAILGAGGHARAVVQLLLRLGFTPEGLYDERFDPEEDVLGVPLRGRPEEMPDGVPCVLAVGDNAARRRLFEQFGDRVWTEPLVHPAAVVESSARLGAGVQVFAFAYVNAEAVVGANTILNTASIVEHEATVGAHSHVAVRATLLGRAAVGEGCFVGAGAVVRNGVRVGSHVTIGANAFVRGDLEEPGTYAGLPARRIG